MTDDIALLRVANNFAVLRFTI